MFSPHSVKIVGASAVGLPEPEETEDSFEGNALLKARHACEITAMPCLADDSGLSVNALDGAPGIYSARWAGPEKDFNMAMNRVWNDLNDHTDKSAMFVAVLTLVMPDGREFVARGETHGTINYPPRGEHGFGYDPIFTPHNDTQTFAEMGYEGKEKYSHRKKAFDILVSMFDKTVS
jgi:XTP/dITP diphosphohydrolase